MKAQERHDLKENDLASWFQYGLPMFLKQNGSYILLVLALCFLGFQLWRMYDRKQEDKRLHAWSELRMVWQSEDVPTSLKTVIETYDFKDVRQQAYLDLGKAYTQLLAFPGQLAGMKMSRAEALSAAYDAYHKALTDYGTDDLIAGKAILGMAGVEEDRGEWDQAKKLYEQLSDKNGRFAGTSWAELGKDKLDTLNDRRNAPRLSLDIPLTRPAATAASRPSGFPGEFGPLVPPEFSAPGGSPPRPEPAATGPAGAAPSPFNIGPVIPDTATQPKP